MRPAYDRKAAFQTVSEVVPVRVKPSSFAAGVFADAGEYGMDRRVIFAKARNDLVLPVIDLSNPRFAVPDDPASLEAQREAFITWYRNQQRMPRFIMRLFLRRAAKRSQLAQAVFQSDKGFLDSISTYVLKLGVENLPRGFDGPIDKRIAGAPHAVFIRLRMQQIAKLLADALVEPLSADAAAPLHLINIAGGPALDSDSINAIILLNRTRPDLLKRRIDIEVLDSQTDGPAFGANALAALKQADGPLHGLAVEFDHRPYDWNEPAVLVQTVAKSRAGGAIVAASSEGGLFEYGSDEAIVANLRGLSGRRGEPRGRFRDQRKRYPKTDDRGDELQAVSARTRRLGPACCAGRLRHPQERTRRCQRSSSFANALAVEHIGARAEHSAENIFRDGARGGNRTPTPCGTRF